MIVSTFSEVISNSRIKCDILILAVHESCLFLSIVTFVAVVQVIFVELGGHAIACSSDGLSQTQWLICLGFAAGGLVMNFLLKLLPKFNFSVIF